MAIGDRLDARRVEFTTQFLPESVLVRIYLVYQVRNKQYLDVQSSDLEDIVRQVTRDWCDEFAAIAIEQDWETRSGCCLGAAFSASLSRSLSRALFPASGSGPY